MPICAQIDALKPVSHVASGFDRSPSNGALIVAGTRNGAPKYQTAGGDFVTLENSGLNWFFYNMDPDIYGPSASPQYEGGSNLTDPYMPQPPNMTAGTVS